MRTKTRIFFFFGAVLITSLGHSEPVCLVNHRIPPPGTPPLICPAISPLGSQCGCPPGYPGMVVLKESIVVGRQQVNSNQLTFSAIGQQAEQIGISCAEQSLSKTGSLDTKANLREFVSCAQGQVVLPEKEQILVDCVAESKGDMGVYQICAANGLAGNVLNPEQKIAAECVAKTRDARAAAICTADELTARELEKCKTNGIGGPNGCFGDNNELVGNNGWTARFINNAISDIHNGPGPNNDVVRILNNVNSDVHNGFGAHNEVFGCAGFVNKSLFHGGC